MIMPINMDLFSENHKNDTKYEKWNKDLEEFKKNVKY